MTLLPVKEICDQCGKIHQTYWGTPACSAHISGSAPLEPCSKAPKKGRTVCRSHGANLPNLARKAERQLALMEAEGEIATLMRECDIPEQHPIDGLLEVVRVSGSMMRLLTIKVGELEEDPEVRERMLENTKTGQLTWVKYTDGEAFWGLDKDSQMVPHVYVQLLKIWSERYERACKTALDAGIDERKLRLAEDTADTFFAAFTKAMAMVEMPPEMKAALNSALAAELRTHSNVIDLI